MDNTIIFHKDSTPYNNAIILSKVIQAIKEVGQNPINQLAEYMVSGEPIYITRHNNARTLIQKIDRIELMEYMINIIIRELE